LPWPGAEAGAGAEGWQRGQSLPGLPAHLYDLFPDRLVESELGEIPEGWRHSTIGEEVTVCGGSTPSTKEPEFWEGGQHCWATPKDLSALKFPVLLDTDRKITDAGLAKISSGLLPVGTVLLSSRAPIGYLAIAEVPTAINQGFIAMKCDGVLPNVFVLQWCRESMDAIVGNANGSTFQEISKTNFRPLRIVVPSDPVLTSFTRSAGTLYRQLAENERESRTLAQLRDTLLPKLISGELRVPDAEAFLKERGL
jgi:type I restriction enzyme S subunit